jgi:DNA-binding response OmpR family regulator
MDLKIQPDNTARERVSEAPDSPSVLTLAGNASVVLEINGVRLDLYRHRAFLDGRELFLTPTEFRVLECLLRAEGRPCTQAELASAALKIQHGCAERVVCHVKELRRKLRPDLIETIYRGGYRFRSAGVVQPERSGS